MADDPESHDQYRTLEPDSDEWQWPDLCRAVDGRPKDALDCQHDTTGSPISVCESGRFNECTVSGRCSVCGRTSDVLVSGRGLANTRWFCYYWLYRSIKPGCASRHNAKGLAYGPWHYVDSCG